jgi:cytochrome P450
MNAGLKMKDLEIVSPENLLNPHSLHHYLQQTDPVHWSDTLQAWFVTRHEDVAACFKDPRLSAVRTQLIEHQLQREEVHLIKDYIDVTGRMMLMKDGAEHAQMRRHANPRFTAHAIEDIRPAIHNIINELLERVQDAGQMDLVKDFSGQLPVRVIMEMFAIPEQDRGDFLKWSKDVVSYFGAPMGGNTTEAAILANEGVLKLSKYLEAAIQERRKKPGKDMLSLMIHAQEEGRMNEQELIANIILVLPAGYITTVDQLSNGVHALLTHPRQLQLLKENPALIKSAVDEIMRFVPTVMFMHRIAIEDISLHGRIIRKGQVVFLGVSAANRDPAVFKDPDSFDITRENTKHFTFGFGVHMCLGALLARRELEIAISTLLQRMPNLRLDEERPPRVKCNSLIFRGFDALPLCW